MRYQDNLFLYVLENPYDSLYYIYVYYLPNHFFTFYRVGRINSYVEFKNKCDELRKNELEKIL